MAAKVGAVEYTFSATTPVVLADIIELGNQDVWEEVLSNLVMRADADNGGRIWFGASDLTSTSNRGGYLAAGEGISINRNPTWFSAHTMFLAAETANDVVYITYIQ